MSSTGQKEAVYLFSNNAVFQGFWFSEFEQLIRNQGQIVDGKGQRVKAAYVVIGPQDFAQAMVLFNLPVNDRGFVDSGWYLPLKRLATSAGHGPNMGDGRIRLACQSQCSISWHKEALWEPATSDFMAVRKAIRDNLIGQEPTFTDQVEQPKTLVNAQITSNMASVLSKRHEDPEVEQLKSELKAETIAYRHQLQQLQVEIERQKSLTAKTERVSESELLMQEMKHLRQTLAEQQDVNKAMQLKLEQQEELQKQVEKLQEELNQAQGQSILGFIQQVEEMDGVLVCFHPGAGHLTINAASMQSYAKNPTAYAAKKCQVDETHYLTWLDHYQEPKCQTCNADLPRIELPRDFSSRLQSYCDLHRGIAVD